jgi:hypothetical protein
MMNDDFDDDYEPRGMGELGDDDLPDPDDSFDVEQTVEGQFDDSDLVDNLEEEEDEEDVGQFEEDADEEMQDRGTSANALDSTRLIQNPKHKPESKANNKSQKNPPPPSPPISAKYPPSHPGPSQPPNQGAAYQPSATPPQPITGNPTAPNPTH